MWTYEQRSGKLTHDGEFEGTGYSGHPPDGLNNPDMEAAQGVGPIPRGLWTIGPAYDDPHLGPCVMHLDPVPPFNAHGRTLFRIHGNTADGGNHASNGCIILGPSIRHLIRDSGDTSLTVIA